MKLDKANLDKMMKLAGQGAAAVGGGTFVAYFFLVFIFRPVFNGGFDHVLWRLLTVAMIIPGSIIAAAHFAFARQLKAGVADMPR